MLVFPTVAPYTFGSVTWEVRIVSTSGLGIGQISVINRTFTIDPMAPRVLDVDIEAYDHRMPSGTQRFEIDVMDHVLLPDDLEAMVWFEWRDDDNGDRWPNEGEHTPVALFPPNDLTASTGTYTLLLDDRSGLNGERVAVYLTGSDVAGHALEDGGSAERNKHLFIYEIGPTRLPSSLQMPSASTAILAPSCTRARPTASASTCKSRTDSATCPWSSSIWPTTVLPLQWPSPTTWTWGIPC